MFYLDLVNFTAIFLLRMILFLFIILLGFYWILDFVCTVSTGKGTSFSANFLRKLRLHWLAVAIDDSGYIVEEIVEIKS